MELLDVIEKRFNVDRFTGAPVSQLVLDRILEAGRHAPSAKNRQPWRFIVVNDGLLKNRMQNACYGQEAVGTAGVVIALCSTNIDYKMPNGQFAYTMDLSFAASFMMMQATHEGLGTGLLTTFDEQEIKHILTVPYSMRIVLLLLVGYPAEPDFMSERLPVERIVSYNHW